MRRQLMCWKHHSLRNLVCEVFSWEESPVTITLLFLFSLLPPSPQKASFCPAGLMVKECWSSAVQCLSGSGRYLRNEGDPMGMTGWHLVDLIWQVCTQSQLWPGEHQMQQHLLGMWPLLVPPYLSGGWGCLQHFCSPVLLEKAAPSGDLGLGGRSW